MRPIATYFYADDPAGPLIDFIQNQHIGMVPVVDRDRRYIGMVSGERMAIRLLPGSLTMIRGAKRLGYLNETPEELAERLADLRRQPIRALLDPRAAAVHPEAPLAETLDLLATRQRVVPVVDDDGRLLGAISFFSILRMLDDVPRPTDGEEAPDA
jgi:CBS-domain-containing membrane protein